MSAFILLPSVAASLLSTNWVDISGTVRPYFADFHQPRPHFSVMIPWGTIDQLWEGVSYRELSIFWPPVVYMAPWNVCGLWEILHSISYWLNNVDVLCYFTHFLGNKCKEGAGCSLRLNWGENQWFMRRSRGHIHKQSTFKAKQSHLRALPLY